MSPMVSMTLTALLGIAARILCAVILYFIIKWAVKNGIKEAFRDMKGITAEEEYVDNLQKGMDKKESIRE